ncbi:atonal bHLH transcription factor 8-like protein net [Amblyomma americanum]|uniref:BHLH domain-containing protein n=1 Tax=Amblyomma americanum TaxID=6943 RepID=A0AAQ4E1A4_AMBAM
MSAASSDDSGVELHKRRNKRKSSEPRRRRLLSGRPRPCQDADTTEDDSAEERGPAPAQPAGRESVIREGPPRRPAPDEDLGLDLTTTSNSPATSATSNTAGGTEGDDECLDLRSSHAPVFESREAGVVLFGGHMALCRDQSSAQPRSWAPDCKRPLAEDPEGSLRSKRIALFDGASTSFPSGSSAPRTRDTFDASDVELIPRTSGASPCLESASGRCAQRNYKGMTRQRRIEANARERSRVHTISAAFEALRRAVPAYADNQKLSKLAILRIAAAYIVALARLNEQDYSCDQRAPSFAECTDLCTRTIQAEGKARRRSSAPAAAAAKDSLELSS